MKLKSLIIACLLIFMYGCSKNDKSEDTTPTSSSISENYDRSFTLTLNDGKNLNMQRNSEGFDIEDNNKAILFTFFTTWCPPCKAEIPHLVSLQDKFKNELRIIGVLMEERTADEISEFIKMYNINYSVAYGESNFFFAKALGEVVGIPYSVLYYPNGKYATHYIGLVPEEMLESDIKKVIS